MYANCFIPFGPPHKGQIQSGKTHKCHDYQRLVSFYRAVQILRVNFLPF